MDKRMTGAASITGVLLLVALMLALYQRRELPVASSASENSTSSTVLNTTEPLITTTIAPLYIMGVWEDKLALFTPPDTSPNQVYDVYLPSLPEEEQLRLRNGIEIYDERALASLLEDYTS